MEISQKKEYILSLLSIFFITAAESGPDAVYVKNKTKDKGKALQSRLAPSFSCSSAPQINLPIPPAPCWDKDIFLGGC